MIRAVEPVYGTDRIRQLRFGEKPLTAYRMKNFLNGPGKVCSGFMLTRAENRLSLMSDQLFVCDTLEDVGLPSLDISKETITCGPRIGIDYAEEARDFPWRFCLQKEV